MKNNLVAFLSESELARACGRSSAYIAHARLCGMINPVGRTGAGTYLYHAETVDVVKAIDEPVMVNRAQALCSADAQLIWRKYDAALRPENHN